MSNTRKRIALFGSTGSIGTQALQVIDDHPDLFQAEILTAGNNADLLIQQAIKYQPDTVVIAQENLYTKVKEALSSYPIKVFAGTKALEQVAAFDTIDIVLIALVGYSGLMPTLRAIEGGKTIALANKECLVVAGNILIDAAIRHNAKIIPVDSEHSAIFQCLAGEYSNIHKILLTASGGPFLHTPVNEMANITKQQALKHPRWDMGAKITIDSSTMMNKGFEVIEARWLFGVPASKIEVVIHPESIIHSMVQFEDGSIKAQMGEPCMKMPIQYAFTFPERKKGNVPQFNFKSYPTFSFYQPDMQKFPCLKLAYEALEVGGNAPCILNAANEIAVEAFLQERIKYSEISRLIEDTLAKASFLRDPKLEDYQQSNAEARQITMNLVHKL